MGDFLTHCVGTNPAPNQLDLDPEHDLQLTPSVLNKSVNDRNDLGSLNTTQMSITCSNVSQENELSSKSVLDTSDGFNIMSATTNDMKQMLKESLDGIYQQLDDIKQHIATEFQKNKKETKEAMKLQHRETRRRLERLEKKTNSGYFN